MFYLSCSQDPVTNSETSNTEFSQIVCLFKPGKSTFYNKLPNSQNSKQETVEGFGIKVIYPKYSKHWPYLLAATMDWDCSEVFNYGLFLLLFKFLGESTF